MKNVLTSIVLTIIMFSGMAQSNMILTNGTAEEVLLGNFDPNNYQASVVIDDHDDIIQGIESGINPDSLKAYIIKMASFENRNTGSDTVSNVTGIGAARRWAFDKFSEFSIANDNRLEVSYFQFDQNICGQTQHRNILAVLPGADTSNHEVILFEGHLDSRCQGVCDIGCTAQGVEDNASGSALVMELARVMSAYTYDKTIVFMLTIGEEQGLFGANAFSQHCKNIDVPIKAVLNNDVIGGIICGQTSSGPSCPGLNDIDSTQVRLFSAGTFNSQNKQLARFLKLQYKEELLSLVDVPMMMTIMNNEDRIGRGGDHIPFRQDGFRAMRFSSANEHGDASNGAGYTDRQHTHNDILGVDTSGNMIIDSFFVDFNYLARNAVINGVGGAMIAIGPKIPEFYVTSSNDINPEFQILITDQTQYDEYRVAFRSTTNDWDSVYTITGISGTITPPVQTTYYISVASVDEYDIESLFSEEILISHDELGLEELPKNAAPFELLQNKPNPFDEATTISVRMVKNTDYREAYIMIRDIQGKEVERLPIDLSNEVNEVVYNHGYGKVGVFLYSLIVDNQEVSTKRMIFSN